jgi:hypothetical protein
MNMRLISAALCFSVMLGASARFGQLRAEDSPPQPMPPFSEVYDLVRSNLTGATSSELNRAAVLGFIGQLQSQVSLVTNAPPQTNSSNSLVTKKTVLDNSYGLLRIGRVAAGLPEALTNALDLIRATNRLKGLIVDLRYADGQDYSAAAQTADLFFKTDQPLLQWGESAFHSSTKNTAIDLPLIVLVNGSTAEAAEALAAALRQADGALLIGSPTAGRAYLFKDVPLSSGQVLRVANGWVSVGGDVKLSDKGLAPDIRVTVNPEDERAFFQDPFKPLPRSVLVATRSTSDSVTSSSTNRPRRRPNEADLVRMQKDGVDLSAELPLLSPLPAPGPAVTDPTLARALDLLKGLALALKRH